MPQRHNVVSHEKWLEAEDSSCAKRRRSRGCATGWALSAGG